MNERININDPVWVKLTPYGERLWAKAWTHSTQNGVPDAVRKASTDVATGEVRFQLWDLMRIFGESMWMGNREMPFVANVMRLDQRLSDGNRNPTPTAQDDSGDTARRAPSDAHYHSPLGICDTCYRKGLNDATKGSGDTARMPDWFYEQVAKVPVPPVTPPSTRLPTTHSYVTDEQRNQVTYDASVGSRQTPPSTERRWAVDLDRDGPFLACNGEAWTLEGVAQHLNALEQDSRSACAHDWAMRGREAWHPFLERLEEIKVCVRCAAIEWHLPVLNTKAGEA